LIEIQTDTSRATTLIPPDPSEPADVAADTAVPARQAATPGAYILPPDAAVKIDGPPPVNVSIMRVPGLTIEANVAAAIVGWAAEHFQTPVQQSLQAAASCYQAASGIADQGTLDETIRSGLDLPACVTAIDVLSKTSDEDAATADDDVLHVARSSLGPLFTDDVIDTVLRVAAHR
jgi:hypothetical protein